MNKEDLTGGQKLSKAVGDFFSNLGADTGNIMKNLGAGVSQVATIPKTVAAGVQGANIPPVETLKTNLTANMPGTKFMGGAEPTINPALLGVVNNTAKNPTLIANATPKSPPAQSGGFGVIDAFSRPTEGSRETFKLLSATQPLGVQGSQYGSFGSDQEYFDWKARGDKMKLAPSSSTATNPNDANIAEISKLLLDASKTAMSEGNLLKRKYDIMAVKAIQDALTGISPLSSFGHFGVEGMKSDIAKGKLGVEQDELGIKKGTLDLAKTKEEREAGESAAKGEYYKANALESKAKAKYYSDQDKPGKFETQAQQAWLRGWTDYQKNDAVLQDIMGKEDPAERDAAIEQHKALYRKLNPPSPIKKIANADGTVTVTFADGTVQRMKKKEIK